jgi:hypothetical protein
MASSGSIFPTATNQKPSRKGAGEGHQIYAKAQRDPTGEWQKCTREIKFINHAAEIMSNYRATLSYENQKSY